jgi:hypothetical protein
MGFTPEQMNVLKAQINIFRKLKKGEPVSNLEVAAVQPRPLHGAAPHLASLRGGAKGGRGGKAGGANKGTPPPPSGLILPGVGVWVLIVLLYACSCSRLQFLSIDIINNQLWKVDMTDGSYPCSPFAWFG